MTSTVFDLVGKYAIEKGLPWTFRYAGPAKTPVDLTGSSARLEIFDSLNGQLIASPSSGAGEIALGGAAGTVFVSLLGSVSAVWTATHLRYRFIFTDAQGVDRIFLRGRLGLVDDA